MPMKTAPKNTLLKPQRDIFGRVDKFTLHKWSGCSPRHHPAGRAEGRTASAAVILPDFVNRWPTPTSRDHKDGDAHSCQNVPVNGLLGREVHMLPTPSSAYAVGSSGGSRGADLRNAAGGSLSPDWVEWLMGVPIGWTSMEPLAQADYAQWLQAQQDGTWWLEERGLPRVSTGIPDRVNRLQCLGNGIVPASLAVFLRC